MPKGGGITYVAAFLFRQFIEFSAEAGRDVFCIVNRKGRLSNDAGLAAGRKVQRQGFINGINDVNPVLTINLTDGSDNFRMLFFSKKLM